MYPDDVTALSNKELAVSLKEYGIVTGPIVTSTRRIYEKKLIHCITGAEIESNHSPAPSDESDEEDVPPSPAFQERISEPRRRILRSGTPESVGIRASSNYTSTPLKTSTSKDTSTDKPGIPLWIKLVSLVIICFVAYLVIQKLQSQDDNNIPRGIDAEV